MAASIIKPDNNSREWGSGAATLRRRLWDLSPGSLPLGAHGSWSKFSVVPCVTLLPWLLWHSSAGTSAGRERRNVQKREPGFKLTHFLLRRRCHSP